MKVYSDGQHRLRTGEVYIFAKHGSVVFFEHDGEWLMPIATNAEAADRFADNEGCSVKRFGHIARHLEMAIEYGCGGLFVTDDGVNGFVQR